MRKVSTDYITVEGVDTAKAGKFIHCICSTRGNLSVSAARGIMLPLHEAVRIKHTQWVDKNRYSVAIKGIPKRKIKAGMIIVPETPPVIAAKTIYALGNNEVPLRGKYWLGNNSFPITGDGRRPVIEVTSHPLSNEIVKLVSSKSMFSLIGGICNLMDDKGNILARVQVFLDREFDHREETGLMERCHQVAPDYSDSEIVQLILDFRGFIPLALIPSGADVGADYHTLAHWKAAPWYIEQKQQEMKSISAIEGGVTIRDLTRELRVPWELAEKIVDYIGRDQFVFTDGYMYYKGSNEAARSLSPMSRQLLHELQDKYAGRVELDKLESDNVRQQYRKLVRMGEVVALTDTIIADQQWYRDTAEQIKRDAEKKAGNNGLVSIRQAKDATGLSRKYIIPLLRYMERDHQLLREGEGVWRIKKL